MDRWLEKDWVLRLLSLLLAIFVWTQVVGTQDPLVTRTFPDVPVAGRGRPRGASFQVAPDAVAVTVRGPRSAAAALDTQQVRAYVGLGGLRPGQYTLPVQVQAGPGVEVASVTPGVVSVTVQPWATASKPVIVFYQGAPAPGYYVGTPNPGVSTAQVFGPADLVQQVSQVGAWISVVGRTSSAVGRVPLRPLAASGQEVEGVRVTPATATVRVPVLPYPERQVPVQVRLAGHPARGYAVVAIGVRPAEVTLRAPVPVPQAVYTQPVDISGITQTLHVRARVVVPDDAALVGGGTVQVTVRVAPALPAPNLVPERRTQAVPARLAGDRHPVSPRGP